MCNNKKIKIFFHSAKQAKTKFIVIANSYFKIQQYKFK